MIAVEIDTPFVASDGEFPQVQTLPWASAATTRAHLADDETIAGMP
jgi:hypothetical protein